jgi:hypothetical protein
LVVVVAIVVDQQAPVSNVSPFAQKTTSMMRIMMIMMIMMLMLRQ